MNFIILKRKAAVVMRIDFHNHLFPDALAARTIPHLAQVSQVPPHSDGTVASTLQRMREWGTDLAVIQHIATKPGQQHNVNKFAVQVQAENPQLLCFGSVHPLDAQALEELDFIHQSGLHGLKLHPAYQQCFAIDKAYFPIYEKLEHLGLPVLFHAGLDPVSPTNYAPADDLAAIAETFPKLTIIAAHMGSVGDPEQARKLCKYENVYFDTSLASLFFDPKTYEHLIREKGVDHVLFATDCPWSTAPAELALLQQLHLTPEEFERIYWKNAVQLLQLKIETPHTGA